MALSKIDVANMVTGAVPVANGGTALTSGFANGITMADQWRLTSDKDYGSSANAIEFYTANLERIDTSGQGTIGSAMTQSSGVFTFPSTGIYKVDCHLSFARNNHLVQYVGGGIQATVNNSAYNIMSFGYDNMPDSADTSADVTCTTLIDVTDTANVKVKFYAIASDASSFSSRGSSSQNSTHFNFLRLGDT